VATNCLSITPATTVPVIVDRLTVQVRAAQIFVAVLGVSNFTNTEESGTQTLAHCAKLLVPDHTKVAVIKACFYESLSPSEQAVVAKYRNGVRFASASPDVHIRDCTYCPRSPTAVVIRQARRWRSVWRPGPPIRRSTPLHA